MVGYLFFGSDRLFTKKEHSIQSWLEEFSQVLFFSWAHALETKSYEKGPFGVFFHLRLNSLNMNDTEFAFIGLIKLYTERPFFGNEALLSQVREI